MIATHADYVYLNLTAPIYVDNDHNGSHRIINHPVHIYDTTLKQLSPSSFIPFCDFGGNKESMGVKVNQFYSPVCSSFEARVLNDQLCYEVDPNRFKDARDSISDSNGLTLFIDTNHERQYPKINMLKGKSLLFKVAVNYKLNKIKMINDAHGTVKSMIHISCKKNQAKWPDLGRTA